MTLKVELVPNTLGNSHWIGITEDGEHLVNFSMKEVKEMLPDLIEMTGYGQADATALVKTGASYDG